MSVDTAVKHSLLIGGKPYPTDQSFTVFSPLDESALAEVAKGSAQEVDLAVTAAKSGFAEWFGLAPKEREAILLKAADLLEQKGADRYLDLLIKESGSVQTKAFFEINYSVDLLRTAAGEVRRLYGDTFPNDQPSRLSMVFREPLGVVAVVSPYNAPLALLTKMAAFPLAAGNAIVIKPSEETPLIALEFGKLLLEAGVPADAISVITGFGAECGKALVAHEGVDGVAVTGSTQTGRHIGAATMQRMVPVQLELGGKSALVVLDDFDPKQAAKIAAQGMFTHAGQICMANSRVVVAASIYQAFLTALKAECEAMTVGNVYDEQSVYGPLINRNAVEKVQEHQRLALEQGAKLLTGGSLDSGLVYQPTVLVDTPSDCSAWCEETFGPLMHVVSAASLEEAIEIANDSDYGLSAGVLTHNIRHGFKAAREIKAGAVHIGMHPFQSNALSPVGGTGLSGIGRSGGKFSTEEFTELKWISVELD